MPGNLAYPKDCASEADAKDRESKLKQSGKVYSRLERRSERSLLS